MHKTNFSKQPKYPPPYFCLSDVACPQRDSSYEARAGPFLNGGDLDEANESNLTVMHGPFSVR